MKKIQLLIIILFSFALNTFAQVPNAINFQATARDANGDVMANTSIQIRLTILDNSETGTEIYQELRALTTNNYGSFAFQIGRNADYTTIGAFTDIDWNADNKFLKIDYDPTNQFDWSLTLGTIEFVTVPYAFSAGSVTYIDVTGVQDGNVLLYNAATGKFEPGQISGGAVQWSNLTGTPPNISIFNNDAGYISSYTETDPIFSTWDKHTGITITESQISDFGTYLSSYTETDPIYSANFDLTNATNGDVLKYNGTKFVTYTPDYLTNEVDGSVTNEIQNLSISDRTLSISDGNSVTLPNSGSMPVVTRTELDGLTPEVGDIVYDSTDDITVMWNGTNWIGLSDSCFPQPTHAIAGNDQEINTADTTVTLTANTPLEGIGTWTVYSGTGGSFADIHDPTTTFNGTSCTDYTLKWSIETVCRIYDSSVNISFHEMATTANAGDDIDSPTQTTVTLNGNNPSAGTGSWSVISGSGGSFSNPNAYNSNFTGNDNETYILRWTTSTACNSSHDEITVRIGNVIGQYKHGGVIFYVDGSGEHGLVCAVSDQSAGTEWGCDGTEISGADGTVIGTGAQNTIDIETDCTTPGTAADICANLTLNGYSDWFLPSKDELFEIYQNISIINTTALNNGGVIFNYDLYWSSSEYSSGHSWYQYIYSSYQNSGSKYISRFVRAVRAF